MAKCDFYADKGWYDHYCLKKDEHINSSTYNTYCNTYKYDQCPIYKQQSSSGGCYLTTACVDCRNLPDDCVELTVLRKFRDEYMMRQPEGPEDIKEYYEKAPQIVSEIDSRKDRKEIYENLYSDVIKPCVEMIECGKNEEAYEKYKRMVRELEKEYM